MLSVAVPKRYTVLGCKFGTPASWATHYRRNFLGLGGYPPGWNPRGGREDDLITNLGMLALHHLGCKIPVEPADWLHRGFDVAVDYFCGDWWRDHPDAGRAVDKSRKRRELRWFNAFSIGLLLGLLGERWDDLSAVCDWVEPGLKPEPLLVDTEEVEPSLADVYLSVAASLRSAPMPRLAPVEARLRASKAPRSRLLFRAWEAARDGDQAAFDEAFAESLAHFAAVAGSGPTPIHWIAPHHSAVGLAASRLGIALPKLPAKLDATLLTRASLGLDEAQPSGRTPGPEISTEKVESMIEKYRAGHPRAGELSARQVTFALRGMMRAKAELSAAGKPLDRDSAEAWFVKDGQVRWRFADHGQFLECLDIALRIVQEADKQRLP
jgi:hypothetical protein